MAECKEQSTGRLVMVNPNGVYGDVQGKPLTPPYEDMCISVNLIVDVVNRTKTDNNGTNSSDEQTSTYIMTWNSQYQTDGEGNFNGKLKETNQVSFLEGEDAKKYNEALNGKNYLTTYYTDISLNEIREQNVVEGLGITNVDISYDNMYMPTIVIKFVDVRGSSLFGREEAVHKQNQLTSETIFGCFFTLPYPKFRLQVKGFYGNAVTYQLACTGFKGNFNSQNGNFEITTTFIGYQFSLLTDIPFAYLIAAPYSEYIGKKYWEEHVATPSWQLAEGKQMMKLYEIYTQLKKNLKSSVSSTLPNVHVDLGSKEAAITQIWQLWVNIKDSIRKRGKYLGYEEDGRPYIDEETHNNYYLFLNDTQITCTTPEIQDQVANLRTQIERYNNEFPNDSIEFDIQNNISVYDENEKLTQYVRINSNSLNYKYELITAHYEQDKFKEWVQNKIDDCNRNDDNFLQDKLYGCTLSDGGFEYAVTSIISKINRDKQELAQRNVDYIPQEISNSITFKPSIGNFFKIIIAHLETFCAMLYHCSSVICEQMKTPDGRSPSTLNVNIANTDVANTTKFIPPFPAIYKKTIQDASSPFAAMGWVGDFSNNFEEEKLIIGLHQAMQRTSDETSTLSQQKVNMEQIFPSMPLDFYIEDTGSVNGGMDLDMIAAHLGLRMAQIFGFLNDGNLNDVEIAKIHGKMDALNFIQSIGNKDKIRDVLFKYNGEGYYENYKNVIKEILTCSNDTTAVGFATRNKHSNNSRYSFEYYDYGNINGENSTQSFNYNTKSTTVHPVMIPNGDKYVYTYLWGGSEEEVNAIVPVVTQNPENIIGVDKSVLRSSKNSNLHNICLNIPVIKEEGIKNPYALQTCNKLLHNCDTKTFLNGVEDSNTKILNYVNETMFNIITNQDEVKSIKKRYEKLKSGIINIDGYSGIEEDLKKIMTRYYDMDINQYLDENVTEYLAKKKSSTGNESFAVNKSEYTICTNNRQFEIGLWNQTKEVLNSKLEFINSIDAFNKDDLSDYFVPYLLCKCADYNVKNSLEVSLDITNAFLNDYSDFIRNGEKEEVDVVDDTNTEEGVDVDNNTNMEDELIAFKCWMILHAIPFKWDKITEVMKCKSNHGGIKRVPLAMVLLLGGAIYFTRKKNRFNINVPKSYNYLKFSKSDKDIVRNWLNYLYPRIGIKTLFRKQNDKLEFTLRHCSLQDVENGNLGPVFNDANFQDITDIFNNENKYFDYFISNKLMETFITWYKSDGQKIVNSLVNVNIKGNWGLHFMLMQTYSSAVRLSNDSDTNNQFYSLLFNIVQNREKIREKIGYSIFCPSYIDEEWSSHVRTYAYGIYDNDTVLGVNNCCNKLMNYKWLSEEDEHWTMTPSDRVAYFNSDASFMDKLLKLYTSDCLLCFNFNLNNIIKLENVDFK